MKNNQNGFTLIELIVVIAIIGILAAVLMPKFSGFITKADQKAVMSEARNIHSACEAIETETGAYPTDEKEVWKYLGKKYDGALTFPGANKFQYIKTMKKNKYTATLEITTDATTKEVTGEKIEVSEPEKVQ